MPWQVQQAWSNTLRSFRKYDPACPEGVCPSAAPAVSDQAESSSDFSLPFVMNAVKEGAPGAVFQFNRINAQNALLIFAECPHYLGAYLSMVRPRRASPGMPPSALRKFPAFHAAPPCPGFDLNLTDSITKHKCAEHLCSEH